MTVFKAGDELMHSEGKLDGVYSKVLFVPPVDGKGVQYYLCEVISLHNDGAKNKFLSLSKEENLLAHFKIRTQPYKWANINNNN